MRLLIGGKNRNIYFRKDNTVYYKNGGNEYDITNFFVKNKPKKMILGGTLFDIFDHITISVNTDINGPKWTFDETKEIYIKLLQLFLLAKTQCDNNGKIFKAGIDDKKYKFIYAFGIITGEITLNGIGIKKQEYTHMKADNKPERNKTLLLFANFTGSKINKIINRSHFDNDKITALSIDTEELFDYDKLITDDVLINKKEFDKIPYERITGKLDAVKLITETTSNDFMETLKNLKALMIQQNLFNPFIHKV
jgi:hypothetical protein|tara:strand:+ start:2610 stop:3365 length:756 start_codon:yes stop_codon:yes gene_type:complete